MLLLILYLTIKNYSDILVGMYVHEIPNRNSRPTFLLREGIRKGKEVLNHTLANISHWPMPRIEALKKTLKGEFDGFVAPPVADRTFGVLFVLKEIANKLGIIRALGKDLMAKLVLFLILARVAHQGSRLSAVRWAQNHAVTEILATPEFDENDLYAALDWVAERQEGRRTACVGALRRELIVSGRPRERVG